MHQPTARRELRDAAAQGIREFLNTTRGAAMFGAGAEITALSEKVLQIRARDEAGTHYFTVEVKASI